MNQTEFRFDMHIHSTYSCDAIMSVRQVLDVARRRGLSAVALTDHNTIAGAQKAAQEIAPTNRPMIIKGEEVSTECGDIIGIFLEDPIRSRLFPEVIDEIRDRDGISIFPHPLRRKKFPSRDLIERIDLFEIFNSRTSPENNDAATHLAREVKKPGIAGSDSHFSWEIGSTYNVISGNLPANEEDLRKLIRNRCFEIHNPPVSPLTRKTNMLLSYCCKRLRRSCIQQ
jgi:predicted metal-dependent phosphoesterase TrpH